MSRSARRSSPIDRLEWVAALGLTLLAVVLHLRVLTHAGPLWRDEANTVTVANRPGLSGMVAALEHESFPVLPFAAVRAWSSLGLGATDFRLRLLGFAVGIGILAAIWGNRRLTRGELPLAALALAALNPVVLRWGDSLRGYGAGALLIVVAFGCMYRLCVAPGVWTFAGAALAAVLAVQCIYQNALLLAAICAGGIALAARRRLWMRAAGCAAVGALAALSLLPYAAIIARAREHFVVITLDANFARIWSAFRAALGAPERPGDAGATAGMVTLVAWLLGLALALFAGVKLVTARGKGEEQSGSGELALYGLVVAVLAPLLFFAFVYRLRFLTEPWYFIVLLAVLAVSIDAATRGAKLNSAGRVGRAAACVAVALVSVVTAFPALGERQTNIDLLARAIRNEAAPGDLVIVNPWFYGISFGRYFDGPTAWVQVPVLADRGIHRFDLIKEQMTRGEPLQPLFERLSETLRSGHKVWIVGSLAAPPKGQPPRRLPPASDSAGWYSAPYLAAWSQEVGFFLQSNSERGRRVPVPSERPVGAYENLALFAVEGWKGAR